MANLLKKKFIGANQIDGSKILLENNQFIRVKNAAGAEVELFKLSDTDAFEMDKAPLVINESSDPASLQTKSQVDVAISVEEAARQSADASLQADIDTRITLAEKGSALGVATLDVSGKVPEAQLDLHADKVNYAATIDFNGPIVTASDALGELAYRAKFLEDYKLNSAEKGVADGVATLNAQGLIPKEQINLEASDISMMPSGDFDTSPVDVNSALYELASRSRIIEDKVGAANGIATLDSNGLIPSNQLPSYVDDVLEYADLASLPATGETGKIYVTLDDGKLYRWSGSTYIGITSGAVDSVNGKQGVVVLDTDDIAEGVSNFYYTQGRFNSDFAVKSTTDLAEGDNKYYTDARVNAYVDPRFLAVESKNTDQDSRLEVLEAGIPMWEKEKFVVDATIIANGYVDLAYSATSKSMQAFIDRLAIHEGAGEDYTVADVGGVTRVTFLNSLVSPGQEAMQAGDNIYISYTRPNIVMA